MTHLAAGLSTTRTSKPKQKKLTQKDIQDYTVAWRAHNKDCRKRYLHSMQFDTVEEYISYCKGEKFIPQKNPIPQSRTKVCEKSKVYPSHQSSIGNCLRKEPPVYSGDRKLIGIAIMHKSNLVPIFEDEDGDGRQEATEIANMGK